MKFLDVRVIGPAGVIAEYKARSVSSNNSAGRFDILPKHANFVTYISGKKINIILGDGTKADLDYPVAIIRAGSDKVIIFVDIESVKDL